MKFRFQIYLAVAALLVVTLACGVFDRELSLDNLRMAFDEDGNNPTTVYSPTDTFFAIADLRNAPEGTEVEAKWFVEQVEGYEPGELIYEQSLSDFTDENFTGTIFFELSNDAGWPIGSFRVALYLYGDLVQSTVFSVR